MRDIIRLVQLGYTDFDRVSRAGRYRGKIKNLRRESYVVRGTVRGDRNYFPQVDLKTGSWMCTCPDAAYHGLICKHVIALLMELTEEERRMFVDALEGRHRVECFVSTGDEKIDKFLLGGVPVGVALNLCGKSKTGKTWFAVQTLFRNGGIYLDAENVFKAPFVYDRFRSIFEKRFGEVGDVLVVPIGGLRELMNLVGLNPEIVEGKKMSLYIRETVSPIESALSNIIGSDDRYRVVVVDSFSRLLKAFFPGGDQNLPVRAGIINSFLFRFQRILALKKVAGIVINHVSVLRDEAPQLYGGQSMMYNFAWIVQIHGPTANDIKNGKHQRRYLERIEVPTFLSATLPVELKKDYGFVAVSGDE